jgi:hypothetical protein
MCRCHACQVFVFAHRKLKHSIANLQISLQLTGLLADLLKFGQPGTSKII